MTSSTPVRSGRSEVDYVAAWESQRQIHAEVKAGERPNTVLLLEHASVYTAGKRTEPHERPLDGTPVVDVDRGGKITWHGPGQLVGYPIVKLPEAVYVVDYVRRLEEALIDLCAEYGLDRRPGAPAAPGCGCRPTAGQTGAQDRRDRRPGRRRGRPCTASRSTSTPTWAAFDAIIPCGITDAGVTSLAAETGESPGLPEVAHLLRPHLERYLSFEPYEQSAPLLAPDDDPGSRGDLRPGCRPSPERPPPRVAGSSGSAL